jgi:hypothetical protein
MEIATGDAAEDLLRVVDRLRSYVLSVCHSLFELHQHGEDWLSDESQHFLLGFARNDVQLYADLIHEDEKGSCYFLLSIYLTFTLSLSQISSSSHQSSP